MKSDYMTVLAVKYPRFRKDKMKLMRIIRKRGKNIKDVSFVFEVDEKYIKEIEALADSVVEIKQYKKFLVELYRIMLNKMIRDPKNPINDKDKSLINNIWEEIKNDY